MGDEQHTTRGLKIVLSPHAKIQIRERHIPLKLIEVTLNTPDRILLSYRERLLYQKSVGGKILEVVAVKEKQTLVVITQYYLLKA